MEEPSTQNEERGISSPDEDSLTTTDDEDWTSTLDVLPPEMHFLIAEQVVAFRDSSACMLTQVTFHSISVRVRRR